jgi:hypothetical protein
LAAVAAGRVGVSAVAACAAQPVKKNKPISMDNGNFRIPPPYRLIV